ncbi:hypothetical protein AB0N38_18895 [Micromonospora aurantiaca]|uniref:Terminase n=1 Tax=Micromonospora aurantiaca (nom. illeg.) TaxID=47850 RepID=A0A6N3JUT5_9ACTN|nr:hypothetical protein [Micromonospora aurantiaca]AXH88783.1 hypothetical protein DVH21_01930 [Micromonospora aurantiaca]
MTATLTELTCPPLHGTPRSPDRPTLGGQLAAVADRLGKPLMPHQRHIADVALELDPETGLLAYSEVVVIGPRQATGKTELLLPVMTHRCVGFGDPLTRWIRQHLGHAVPEPGPQTVVYTAQTADDARKKWRDVHVARLEKSVYRRQFTPRLRLNAEAMIWRNGSRWSPASTTGKTAGTGDSIDVPVIDEAWSRPDSRTELGMRPASMTRPWRQMWVMSMIPGLSRAMPGTWPYLAHKRQVGRARVAAGMTSGTAFFDFSAAPDLDPGDPQTWWSCMPGLGHTVPEKAIREDYEAMDLVDFCAEYLGWEPMVTTPKWRLIRQETWENLHDPASAVHGRPALAVEMARDRSRGVIGVAGRRADRHWHAAVAEPGYQVPAGVTGVEWMMPRLLELIDEADAVAVVIDPRRPANSLIAPLRNRGVTVLTPNQQEVAAACGRFYDATGEDADATDDAPADPTRLFHLGQASVARALGAAVKLDVGEGAFTIVKRGSGDELIDLYALILAMHGHEVMDPGDYDIADSVDQTVPCLVCGRQLYCNNGQWVHCDDDSGQC